MSEETQEPAKPKRTRGPRKSTLRALEQAKAQGYNEGYAQAMVDRAREPTGLLLWLALCFSAGVVVAHYLPF